MHRMWVSQALFYDLGRCGLTYCKEMLWPSFAKTAICTGVCLSFCGRWSGNWSCVCWSARANSCSVCFVYSLTWCADFLGFLGCQLGFVREYVNVWEKKKKTLLASILNLWSCLGWAVCAHLALKFFSTVLSGAVGSKKNHAAAFNYRQTKIHSSP